MNALRSRVSKIATLVSLLACVALVAPWAGSYGQPWIATLRHNDRPVERRGSDFPYVTTTYQIAFWRASILVCRTISFPWRPAPAMTKVPSWEHEAVTDRSEWFANGWPERGDLVFNQDVARGHPWEHLGVYGWRDEPSQWTSSMRSFDRRTNVQFPAWMLLAVLMLWPCLRAAGRLRRARRRRLGLCTNCAYDLTGNTSGVCPECGTAIVSKRVT